jgi:hypothetical protein
MPPKEWKPPEGFRQTGLLVREEYYRMIQSLAARAGKRPWQALDQVLARGLDGLEIPPVVDFDAIFKKPRPTRKK